MPVCFRTGLVAASRSKKATGILYMCTHTHTHIMARGTPQGGKVTPLAGAERQSLWKNAVKLRQTLARANSHWWGKGVQSAEKERGPSSSDVFLRAGSAINPSGPCNGDKHDPQSGPGKDQGPGGDRVSGGGGGVVSEEACSRERHTHQRMASVRKPSDGQCPSDRWRTGLLLDMYVSFCSCACPDSTGL